MTLFASFDLMFRGAAIALFVLWTWLLVRDQRKVLAARIAVVMNVTIVAHILATVPMAVVPQPLRMMLDIASVTATGWFWLFTRAWFDDEKRIGPTSWAALAIPVVCVSILYAAGFDWTPPVMAAAIVLRLSMIGFGLAGLWVAWKGRSDDLVEARRRIRWRLVATVGAFMLVVNVIEVLVQQEVLVQSARSVIEMLIALITLLFCAAMFGFDRDDLFGPPARTAPHAAELDPAERDLVAKLREHMEREKAHRLDGLTIASLAAQLGEPEYRLRRAINGTLGHRNFAQFLNGYRLAEVREALADPAQREVPIITIALDAGFGSLGPFNRAFREAEGVTPSEWRKTALADSGIG